MPSQCPQCGDWEKPDGSHKCPGLRPKPTIEELEKILEEGPGRLTILPNGEIRSVPIADQERVDILMKELDWEYWKPGEIILQMASELGELADVVNYKFGPKKLKSEPTSSTETLDHREEEEVGDLYYGLCCYANSRGLDLRTMLTKAMEKFGSRDKERFK